MQILRDEYLAYMTGTHVRRPLFGTLFGLLVGLDEEWRAQGASEEEITLEAFDFDRPKLFHVRAHPGLFGGTEPRTLEETDEYYIKLDWYGRRIKLHKKYATIPLPLDYPVKGWDDWMRFKPLYQFNEERFAEGWAEEARAARDAGAALMVGMPGGFDEVRQLMGEEEACCCYYEEPELMHDIMNTIGETVERVYDRVSAEVQVDILAVHEDMAGKSGSLIGPNLIEEFVKPYYRRVWDLLSSRGATLFDQDSDGNMNSVIDAFLDAGLNMMHPVEPAAGMDPVPLREAYGDRLALAGGLDKLVIRETKEKIRAELEYKMQPAMRRGGVYFALDHRVPNGTPVENYRYYVQTAREILGLPPLPHLA